ncbi:hypothetical protein HYH02_004595 [Chlamydomonas schloesseri]|uniref:Uncharacterized protein n=1 Tax=Chlamydomonas schloesseri TaxID=2026947 RepID=A0A836B8L5_9CHLO|nr:hypothetical protein HYH02_004595 [Chlamydomonas schloesseri]|eukprot:KAG2450758.1 hypothetical protein HYH02_004595 [Chlamydomonas schloesseri]
MARLPPQQGLWAAAQSLLAARSSPSPAAAAAAAGGSPTHADFAEVALTPEELPPGALREALKRTLAISAGTLPLRDLRRLLQEHYARYAVYETNLLWCPHSTALAAWLGAAHVLLMPYVEGIRCHRVVLRRVAAAPPAAAASAAESYPPPAAAAEAATAEHPPSAATAATAAVKGAAQALRQRRHEGRGAEGEGEASVSRRTGPPQGRQSSSGEVQLQMQLDVAFSWRPLAPLHTLLAGWTGGLAGSSARSAAGSSSALRPTSGGGFGLLPLFTTEHTITLSINAHDKVVEHRDITHNFPLAPGAAKGLLGLPTPLVATLLHV